ncbi:hypothetical protein ACFL59_04290 [Planctomycetota bacterium]
MDELEKRNLVAQWAFDTRPVLRRFHLWLEDVEVDWERGERHTDYAFVPQGLRRCLAMSSAVTCLGTRLFGGFGEAAGADKQAANQAKKHADAVAAYILSESLWHLTRSLPENHAIMICLGEGLMPKGGETPEMGANPLLGFGRVYARPVVAKFIDRQIHKLINRSSRWEDFYQAVKERGITIWGAAVDTLENTSRFAKGADTGPMTVFHLFDQPLTVCRPYEAYMGCLTVPRAVVTTAEEHSILLDFTTARAKVLEAIELCYPGIKREHIHVWTLRGKTRERRIGGLWKEWSTLGVHLVEDGWVSPAGKHAFTESGTYAPTYMVGTWTENGDCHVFLCDGYAASAEAMQAASLSEALEVAVTLAPYSPKFELSHDREYKLMKLRPDDVAFEQKVRGLFENQELGGDEVQTYRAAIQEAYDSNIPLKRRVVRADDFFPEKQWRILASSGYMCEDPYTGSPGVEDLGGGRYGVTSRLATRKVAIRMRFVFRLMETFEQSRLVFSPLLVRFMSGTDYRDRPVRISDSGRIRNELQTLISQALEYESDRIRVHFDRIGDKVLKPERQAAIREILTWYKENHPQWFRWLELV